MTSSGGIESTAVLVILAVLCASGVLSNALVLVIILMSRVKGVTEWFIGNLAINDLLLAAVALPIQLAQGFYGGHDYHGGDLGCKLMMFLPMFTIAGSIYTMTAMSLDRYITIVRQRPVSQFWVKVSLLVVWLLALGISSPQLYEYSVYEKFEEEENETEISCGSNDEELSENFETIYASILVVICYWLPLLIIGVNYFNVARYLWRASFVVNDANTSANHRRTSYKKKVTKTLFVITLVFALLYAPYFIIFTMEEVTGTDETSANGSVRNVVKHVVVAMSAVSNPVLYALMNPRFRIAARKLLCCSIGQGQPLINVAQSLSVSRRNGTSHSGQPNGPKAGHAEQENQVFAIGGQATPGPSTRDIERSIFSVEG